ncbi:unnamed protein product [Phyllotreta striolata]|uniref:Uncharacterized protein n=1 Tax=Phyllotreta striolata TaxID=444603 RepID=A0A9N9TYC9_PHYSR|nr:unnamed protein product [Phyllotreta striolata]
MGFKETPQIFITGTSNSVIVTSKKSSTTRDNDKNIDLPDLFSRITQIDDTNNSLLKISVLELPHCQLTELPTALENLQLKHLDISYNNFENVPTCIYSGLKQLEHLNLGHNLIEKFDILPGCVSCIKTIKLNHNLFKNLPKWIVAFRCTELTELNFSYNQSTNYEYTKNSYSIHIMRLKKLKLRNSQLLDIDYDFLKTFKHLQYLDLSNKYSSDRLINKFHEIDDLFLKLQWKRLEVLKLCNLTLTLFPEGISWVETLKELYINQNCLSWIPKGIEFMVNLRVLDVSDNNLIAIPEEVAKLESLEVILANKNGIEICPDFTKMPSLRTLDLYDNMLEEVSISCEKLQYADLEYNYIATSKLDNYEFKKLKYRESKSLCYDRVDTTKEKTEHSESSSSSSEDSDCSYNVETRDINAEDCEENWEDWDKPSNYRERNPEIDSQDESWTGEDDKKLRKKEISPTKIYVQDEDWMFEDVEEINNA